MTKTILLAILLIGSIFAVKIREDPPADTTDVAQQCITVYSECEFKGQEASICKDNDDLMSNVGFKIKSVKVPTGFEVTFHDEVNFSGETITIKEDHSCFVENDFNFIAMDFNMKVSYKGNLKRN